MSDVLALHGAVDGDRIVVEVGGDVQQSFLEVVAESDVRLKLHLVSVQQAAGECVLEESTTSTGLGMVEILVSQSQIGPFNRLNLGLFKTSFHHPHVQGVPDLLFRFC